MHFLDQNGWFALKSRRSFFSPLWSRVSEDSPARPALFLWPFRADMVVYNTGAITALPLLSFLSPLLMRDQRVFVHAGWQPSSMFTTPEGEASLSQNRWGGLACPLSLPPLSLAYGPRSPGFNILTGLRLRNNKLIGLPKVYALVEVTLSLS